VSGSGSGLLSADERVGVAEGSGEGGGAAGEVVVQGGEELGAGDDGAGAAGFADPVDVGRGVVEAEVADGEGDDLGGSDSGEAESEDEFVA